MDFNKLLPSTVDDLFAKSQSAQCWGNKQLYLIKFLKNPSLRNNRNLGPRLKDIHRFNKSIENGSAVFSASSFIDSLTCSIFGFWFICGVTYNIHKAHYWWLWEKEREKERFFPSVVPSTWLQLSKFKTSFIHCCYIFLFISSRRLKTEPVGNVKINLTW